MGQGLRLLATGRLAGSSLTARFCLMRELARAAIFPPSHLWEGGVFLPSSPSSSGGAVPGFKHQGEMGRSRGSPRRGGEGGLSEGLQRGWLGFELPNKREESGKRMSSRAVTHPMWIDHSEEEKKTSRKKHPKKQRQVRSHVQ